MGLQVSKEDFQKLIEDVALIKRVLLKQTESEEDLEPADDVIEEIEEGKKAPEEDFISHEDILKR